MHDHEYSSSRSDLQQAVEELTEAGYSVTYTSMPGGGSLPEGDLPQPEFGLRINRGEVTFDGTGPSQDEAFVDALARYREAGG